MIVSSQRSISVKVEVNGAYRLTFDSRKMSEEVDINHGKVVFSERPIEHFSTRVKLSRGYSVS